MACPAADRRGTRTSPTFARRPATVQGARQNAARRCVREAPKFQLPNRYALLTLRPSRIGSSSQPAGTGDATDPSDTPPMHRVADRETGHRAASPGDNASGFNAERLGRLPPKVPAAGTGDLVPVPHAAAAHFQQHLIRAQPARPRQLKGLNRGRVPAYPRRPHTAPPGHRRHHDCAPPMPPPGAPAATTCASLPG